MVKQNKEIVVGMVGERKEIEREKSQTLHVGEGRGNERERKEMVHIGEREKIKESVLVGL